MRVLGVERKCRLVSAEMDPVKRTSTITVEVEGPLPEGMETSLQGVDLKLTLVKYRKKRSLDANAYYWVLVTQIAEALKIGKVEAHNQLLSDYGQLDMQDGQVVSVMLREDIDWRRLAELHLRPTSKVITNSKGTTFRCYFVCRGSHTYDTKEMSVLINGTVSEAKELGIETLTPAEIQRMLNETKKAVGADR